MKDRDREDDRERVGDRDRDREYERENVTNGDDRKGVYTLPNRPFEASRSPRG